MKALAQTLHVLLKSHFQRLKRGGKPEVIGAVIATFIVGSMLGVAIGKNAAPRADIVAPVVHQEPQVAGAATSGLNLIEAAKTTQYFTNAVAILHTSGMDQNLLVDGPLTVFLPTNDALQSATQNDIPKLLSDSYGTAVKKLLGSLIVPGAYTSAELRSLAASRATLTARDGSALQLSLSDSVIHIGSAQGLDADITTEDLLATNGVIHGISRIPAIK